MLGLLVSLLVTGASTAEPAAVPVPATAASPAEPASPDPTPAVATAAAESSHHRRPAGLPPSFPVSPLRKLMQAQLDSAPRDDGADGLTAAEADAVMAHYLASIGKPVGRVTRP